MQTLQNRLGLLVTALVVTALAGCGTSQKESPPPIASVAPAPEVTPPAPPTQHAKSIAAHARMSAEASTKLNTAMVLSQIHQTNLMEVELAKIAREKGSTDGVRAYADQLVQDHSNLDQTVIEMAQKSGSLKAVRRAAHETAPEKSLQQKLKAANGAKFDKLFLQQASSDHDKLIRKLQQDREDATDDQLEAMIDKMIPILQQHKELAQILINKEEASEASATHG